MSPPTEAPGDDGYDMLRLLWQMQSKVRDGTLEGLGVVTATRGGNTGCGFVLGSANVATLHTAASRLARELLDFGGDDAQPED